MSKKSREQQFPFILSFLRTPSRPSDLEGECMVARLLVGCRDLQALVSHLPLQWLTIAEHRDGGDVVVLYQVEILRDIAVAPLGS
jgi:hypothetical protein